MGSHVPAIIIAFLAYSILDLGKAFQKVGLAVASRNRARGIGIWIAASLATSASSFLILYAVSLGSVLIVGAMAGTGLAAVIVLSRFLMKTPVGRNELLGVACVMAAPFLLATVYHEPRATRLVIEHLFYFLGAALTVFTILILIFRRGKKMLGILLAGGAGTLGGFVILFQKISTSAVGRDAAFLHFGDSGAAVLNPGQASLLLRLAQVFANPYAVAWIAISLLSTLVLQFSYKHGEAIRLIPSFNSAYILIPILGGAFIFREPLHPIQWGGVFLMLCGVSILSFWSSDRGRSSSAGPSARNGGNAAGSAKR